MNVVNLPNFKSAIESENEDLKKRVFALEERNQSLINQVVQLEHAISLKNSMVRASDLQDDSEIEFDLTHDTFQKLFNNRLKTVKLIISEGKVKDVVKA